MPKLFIVSHTHWDREWYEPFQVYRARLIRCVDKLLDIFATDPDYKYFLLDGQTIVLEDYLEVRPDRERVLRDLVKAGQLQIGPWYVLPDEFLVSGEAIIRNLVRGLRIARDFGDTQPVGYIPDPFGHISQMPQILRGLGIDAAVFRRGLADEPTEVAWQAPDGSQVLACYLRDGYDNAAWLGHDDASFVRNLEQAWRSLAAHAVTPNILLLNGNDHMEPWADLSHLLRVACEQLGEVEIIHASLPMYVAQVQADLAARNLELGVVQGELRNPKRHHLLPGVLSTRMWIKQRNARAQLLLEKWAEPFAAFADLEGGRMKDEGGKKNSSFILHPSSFHPLIDLAWKYLLQNHPHDSICGCGVDQTHAEMALRFDWVEQIVEPIIAETLAQLATLVDTHTVNERVPVVVFNPVAGPRIDRVVAQIELPGGWEDFVITNGSGNAAPFQILSRRVDEYYHKRAKGESLGGLLGMVEAGRIMGMAIQNVAIFADENPIRVDVTLASQGDPHPALQQWQQQLRSIAAENSAVFFEIRGHSPARLEIEFVASEVPGYGYKTFTLSKAGASSSLVYDTVIPARFRRPAQARAESSKPVELDARQKHSGMTTEQIIAADRDLIVENEFYRVEPNLNDGTLTITDKTTGQLYPGLNRFVDGADRGDLYNYCPLENDGVVDHPFAVPQITSEKNAVRQSLRISMIYQLPMSLTADRTGRSSETVEARIDTVVSLSPGVHRIDFQTRVDNPVRDHRLRVEFPTPIVSQYVDAEQAFDVVRRSINLPTNTADWIEQPRPEAPLQNFVSISDGRSGLTLVTRGLPEYQARRDTQGTTLALTLLRCVGWLSRDDLTTRSGHAGPALETPGAQEIGVHEFEYALIPTEGDWRNAFVDAHAFVTPLRAVAASAHGGGLAPTASFVDVTPHEFVISAIKHAEDGHGLIIRGYNIGDQPIDVTLHFYHQFKRAARVNLNEEEIASIDLRHGCEVRLPVRGKEIVTWKVVP